MATVPFVVVVRCRGLSPRELALGEQRFPSRQDTGFRSARCDTDRSVVEVVDPDSAYDAAEHSDRTFRFDKVFDAHATNADVFDAAIAPLVRRARAGFNATCFAYGMTGAGKTHTMTGNPRRGVRGVCAMAVDRLFAEDGDGSQDGGAVECVTASYLEIYNERLRDLLVPDAEPARARPSFALSAQPAVRRAAAAIDVVEDPHHGIRVPGLTDRVVVSGDALEQLIAEGAQRRTKASTAANAASSRSHAVLQLTVRRHLPNGDVTTARLSLIDLAGSERAAAYGSDSDWGSSTEESGARRREGANINRSLLALGSCLTVLGQQAAAVAAGTVRVPYRDSKLTRLLQESLGGNTHTVMLAAVSPSCVCYDETLATLRYATSAKLIQRTVKANRSRGGPSADHGDLTALGTALSADVARLRAELAELKLQRGADRPRRLLAPSPSLDRDASPPPAAAPRPVSPSPAPQDPIVVCEAMEPPTRASATRAPSQRTASSPAVVAADEALRRLWAVRQDLDAVAQRWLEEDGPAPTPPVSAATSAAGPREAAQLVAPPTVREPSPVSFFSAPTPGQLHRRGCGPALTELHLNAPPSPAKPLTDSALDATPPRVDVATVKQRLLQRYDGARDALHTS